MACFTFLAPCNSALPASVKVNLRVVRYNSCTPSSSSNRANLLLTTEFVRPFCSATLLKLPNSIT
ncbi:Uncharacterised protein [Vibrio cholerae]|nr:Uncharacterised protein [Vibrio cholerae]